MEKPARSAPHTAYDIFQMKFNLRKGLIKI